MQAIRQQAAQQANLELVSDAVSQLASGTSLKDLAKLERHLTQCLGVTRFEQLGLLDEKGCECVSLLQLLACHPEMWQLLQPHHHDPNHKISTQHGPEESTSHSSGPAAAAAVYSMHDLDVSDIEQQLDELCLQHDQADDYAEIHRRRAVKAAEMEEAYAAAQMKALIEQLGPIPQLLTIQPGGLSYEQRQERKQRQQEKDAHHKALQQVYNDTFCRTQHNIQGCRQRSPIGMAEEAFHETLSRTYSTKYDGVCAAAAAAAAYAASDKGKYGPKEHVEFVARILKSQYALWDLSCQMQWPPPGSSLGRRQFVIEAVKAGLIDCWDATVLQTVVMWDSVALMHPDNGELAVSCLPCLSQ